VTVRFLSGDVVAMPEGASIPSSHLPWCFGCGPENEQGLGVRPRIEDDLVVADLQFAPWFQGGPGVVHGGASAAFFDDLMGFVPMAHLAPAVTARFEINYRRPIPLGATVRGEAWLTGREGRKLWAESAARDPEGGAPFVEARALYVQIGPEHYSSTFEDMPREQQDRLAGYRPDEYYP